MAFYKLNSCKVCGVPVTGQLCLRCYQQNAAIKREIDGDNRRCITIKVSGDYYLKASEMASEMGISVTQVATMAFNEFIEAENWIEDAP